EYCLRLQLKGYKILINHAARLIHQPGTLTSHNFLGRNLCTSNHNYVRRYYITRNRLEILNEFKHEFPEFISSEKNKNLIEIIKVILFESDKLKKVKSFLLGYIDFKRRRFGPFNNR